MASNLFIKLPCNNGFTHLLRILNPNNMISKVTVEWGGIKGYNPLSPYAYSGVIVILLRSPIDIMGMARSIPSRRKRMEARREGGR